MIADEAAQLVQAFIALHGEKIADLAPQRRIRRRIGIQVEATGVERHHYREQRGAGIELILTGHA